jgi:PhnB protein
MAKAAKKKAKAAKKSARVTAKPKAAAKSAKPAKKKAAKPSKPAARKTAAPKIDPLNRKAYGAISPNLIVSDIRKSVDFYKNALGFSVRAVMDSPYGAMHAELRYREVTLMLSPVAPNQGNVTANSLGNTPATMYVLVENVDNTFNSAVAAGGKAVMPVMDMFWGDRCGVIADLDGNKWMIATHKSEPTEAEMAEAMRQMMSQPSAGAAASAGGESEY